MKDRTTQLLLAVIAILLAAQYFRPAATESAARANDATAESVTDVVRARLFELVDEHGQVRANLKIEDGGSAMFRIRDANGDIRVKLGGDADGSGLVLINGQAEPGVHMLAKRDGTSISLAEAGKAPRVIKP